MNHEGKKCGGSGADVNEEDGLCLECVCFGREPYCEEGRDFLRPVRRLKAVVFVL